MERIYERKLVDDSQLLVNGKVMNKVSVVSHISDWVRSTFIFRAGETYLPEEKPLPVNNVEEELASLAKFKGTGKGAMEYLVLVVLAIGIKIGREMERNERIPEHIDGDKS